jgi:WD40 repeat protein/tetratricopeptide (TPR) repeat protein
VLTQGSDGAVKLWDLATTASRGRYLGQYKGLFSPDGRTLATVTYTGLLELWDSATGQKVRELAKSGSRMAIGLAFSPDGKVLAATSPDAAAIRLWDVEKGGLLREIPASGQASFLTFSNDGRRLVANCDLPDDKSRKPGVTHELTVWDVTDSQVGRPLVLIANATYWERVAVSKDARFAALVDATGAAVYDLATGQRQASLLPNVYSRHFAFSPDGEAVAAACEDFVVRVWNSSTGDLLWQREHAGWVHTVDFSHDGGRLLSTSYDGTARIWNAKTGEPLVVMTHRGPVNGAYFSRDGRLVVTMSDDKTARVWEAATGHPITPPLLHSGNVTRQAEFSPDASRLFTVSYTPAPSGNHLWLWKLRQETRPLPELNLLARTLGARELGGDGLLLNHTASAEAWQELRRDWPEGFRATRDQELEWHLREARACGAAKLWAIAALHWQRVAELEPNNASFQNSLGDALTNSGQLPAAIGAFTRAAELLPPQRNTLLGNVAALHLANRDNAGYRQVCAKLFNENKDTDVVNNLNGLCWTLCFAPDAHPDLRGLADKAARLLTKDAKNWALLNTAGCFLYRAGRDDDALKGLQASMRADPSGEGSAFDWVFLAMLHHRQGRPEEARKWLDKTKSYLADASVGKAVALSEPLWRIKLEFLIREAEAVLADDTKANGASKTKGD